MKRSGGILLHITSLPGKEGCGTLGVEACHFIDQLAEAGITLWQILPLGPTGYGNSPYLCYSAFAGNPLLVSLSELVLEGLLNAADLKRLPGFSNKKVEFQRIDKWKISMLRKAFASFYSNANKILKEDYFRFLEEHNWWLNDYALFIAQKQQAEGASWMDWEPGLKKREQSILDSYRKDLNEEVEFRKFVQFIFFRQWFKLKGYAHSKGVLILGDMPLYVAGDSVDVWANADIFLLDDKLNPKHVGGVPPDYFSETGQLWGNPVYNWQRLKERGFDWWMARLHFNLRMFDFVRIDHFRGLESFWSVPAKEKTAINGKWELAMGYEMLSKFQSQVGEMKLVAEDLGLITPEVEKLRNNFGLPGMKVLQFAFSSDATNKDLPHNYERNFIAYTGTHDNDTTLGWFNSAKGGERKNVRNYFKLNRNKISHWAIEWVWASVADVAIVPMQDVLSLGTKSRMNIPGTASGNWGWRLKPGQLKSKHIKFLSKLNLKYDRACN